MSYNLSNYDFLNNKYNFEDYMESFTTALGILFLVYMLLISRSEPMILLVIIFGIIFTFLIVIQKKYKDKYDHRLKIIRSQIKIIKKKLYNNTQPVDNNVSTEEEYGDNNNVASEEEYDDDTNDKDIESLKINPYNLNKMEGMLGIFET